MNILIDEPQIARETRIKLDLRYAGIHPQEDRDARFAVKAAGQPKKRWQMIRIRVPVGILSAGQYLALDDIAERYTYNRSLRITTGQSIQLHGLAESETAAAVAQIESAGLAAGCHRDGFEFAIAVSPVPRQSESYHRLRTVAAELCDAFYPKPGAPKESHPAHAPRKLAIGLSLPEDNTANVFANDLGFLVVPSSRAKDRVNIYAGGSLSMPTRRSDTYARLATPLGSLPLDQVISAVRAITTVFARHGELVTRRHIRLKYVVDELGVERFRREVEAELGFALEQPIECGELKSPSWFGAQQQGDGNYFYGLGLPYGRIRDVGLTRFKSAIRLIVEAFRPNVILAPDQNLILGGLAPEQTEALERILTAYHIPFGKALSPLRFAAMACAGLPTCPLAVAESERVADPLVAALEGTLARIGKADAPFTFRISGCSIGCIRPNMIDLGAIGRKPGHYDVYVGGSEAAGRFGELYAESVPLGEIVPTVTPLLEFWASSGLPGEAFSDFYARRFGHREQRNRLIPGQYPAVRERVEQIISQNAMSC